VKVYTGVGSRKTPVEIQDMMTRVAEDLGDDGWLLRSGGAGGADRAFEMGSDNVYGPKEIYLPWEGFSFCRRNHTKPCQHLFTIGVNANWTAEATEIAKKLHPNWNALTVGGAACHIRNVMQVLGATLDKPADVVICWTPRGRTEGGTATAIKLALEREIPVINLGGNYWTVRKLLKRIREIGNNG
jgi:hypothetical protein